MSLNGPVESLLEVTLNAPADGYAVVTGSADFFLIHNTGTSSHGFPGVSNQSTLPSGDEKAHTRESSLSIPDTSPLMPGRERCPMQSLIADNPVKMSSELVECASVVRARSLHR